jgi:hypothetical protein
MILEPTFAKSRFACSVFVCDKLVYFSLLDVSFDIYIYNVGIVSISEA